MDLQSLSELRAYREGLEFSLMMVARSVANGNKGDDITKVSVALIRRCLGTTNELIADKLHADALPQIEA